MGSWASHIAEVDRNVLGKFCGQEMHNFTIFAWQGQVLPPVGQGENQDLDRETQGDLTASRSPIFT